MDFIILKWYLSKWNLRALTALNWLRIGTSKRLMVINFLAS